MTKRKLEQELQMAHAELEDAIVEQKAAEEKNKKAIRDAALMANELKKEQDQSIHYERMKRGFEANIKVGVKVAPHQQKSIARIVSDFFKW